MGESGVVGIERGSSVVVNSSMGVVTGSVLVVVLPVSVPGISTQ